MNSLELWLVLTKNCKYFKGIYAADEIFNIKPPGFIVVNTGKKGNKGKHWIAMFINNQTPEFFDSLGKTPASYHERWHKYLIKRTGKYIYNNKRIQKMNSNDCGKFCLVYCILRSRGISFKSIIKLMKTKNLDELLNCLTVNGIALNCV